MKFGIIPNLGKDTELKTTKDIVSWLTQNKVEPLVEKEVAERLGLRQGDLERERIYAESSIVIVLGGDGTLLNIARQAAKYNVPIFGINLGHLGFLTEAELGDMQASLGKLLRGEYCIEKRLMLEAVIENGSRKVESFIALNDIGITRGPFSRIITYSIFINERFVDLYSADGIIISSPTGSTAYSLSAGGPIVSPDVDVFIITPICPHTLHSRSIIVSSSDVVKVEICDSNTEIMLTVDGQHGYKIRPGDIVTVKQSPCHTNLVKLSRGNFFNVLRRKMSERWNNKNL